MGFQNMQCFIALGQKTVKAACNFIVKLLVYGVLHIMVYNVLCLSVQFFCIKSQCGVEKDNLSAII